MSLPARASSPSSIVLCELADAAAYGVPSLSPFCLKAHRALQLAGLPYERRHGAMPSTWTVHNATGQVPVLLIDGQPIADSTNILRWVVSRGGLAESPEAWLWEELADTAISGFLVGARWMDDANWPRTKAAYFAGMPAVLAWFVPGRLRANVGRMLHARDVWRAGPAAFHERFDHLLDQLDGRAPAAGLPWVGAEWSVADVALYGQLRSFLTPLTPGQAEKIAARPRLAAWIGALDPIEARRPAATSVV